MVRASSKTPAALAHISVPVSIKQEEASGVNEIDKGVEIWRRKRP